jgi:twitching motility protein PilT
MVDLINRERRAKIITIEDPVEYAHENRNSIIIQQEVYTDTPSFGKALVHVLRQDPDVIAVGEMRDLETIATALTDAETGHLVLATLHTPDAVQTVQRILGDFPADQQNNIVYQVSNSLQAIIAQQLLPRADGKGQVLACEICIATAAIRKLIRDGESHLMVNEIQMGKKPWRCSTFTTVARSPTTRRCPVPENRTSSGTRRRDIAVQSGDAIL